MLSEIFSIHFIDLREVIHIFDEDRRFYDRFQRSTRFLQYSLEVLEHLVRLLLDIAIHHDASGSQWNLA
ncbi:Uncharacterised protein [Mycobacteroides abscessus subsp. abscessus]|nr:Uncharacterised protein [Mycobacteroides abscessus subsp. abscessus]